MTSRQGTVAAVGVEAYVDTSNATAQLASDLTTAAESGAAGVRGSLAGVAGDITGLGKSMTAAVTLPLVALGTGAAAASISMESAFAGVTKTVDGTSEELAQMRQEIIDLSKEVPASAEEIAGVAEAAGQLGIETENVVDFTATMVDLGEATNLSADEAATALARLANITQMPQDAFDELGSTIVALGNNLATTEAEIVDMGLRIAGAGEQVGLTEDQILGVAGALSSVGIAAEAGGTAVSRVMLDMSTAVADGGADLEAFATIAGYTAEDFAAAFQQDAAGAITDFVKGLGAISDEGGNVVAALDTVGLSEIRVRDALLRLSGAGDLLTDSLALSNEAWQENTALTDEAAQRYETSAAKLEILRNKVADIFRTLGDSLVPVLIDTVEAAEPLINMMQGAVEAFGALPAPVKLTAVGLAGVAAAAGPLLYMVGKLATAVAPGGALVTGFKALGVSAAVGGPVALGLAAVAVGIGVVFAKSAAAKKEVADLTEALEGLGDEAPSTFDVITGLIGEGDLREFREAGVSIEDIAAAIDLAKTDAEAGALAFGALEEKVRDANHNAWAGRSIINQLAGKLEVLEEAAIGAGEGAREGDEGYQAYLDTIGGGGAIVTTAAGTTEVMALSAKEAARQTRDLGDAMIEGGAETDPYAAAIGTATEAVQTSKAAEEELETAILNVVSARRAAVDPAFAVVKAEEDVRDARQANDAAAQAVTDAEEDLREARANGNADDVTAAEESLREAYEDLEPAQRAIIDAVLAQQAAQGELISKAPNWEATLRATAMEAGLTKDVIDGMVDSIKTAAGQAWDVNIIAHVSVPTFTIAQEGNRVYPKPGERVALATGGITKDDEIPALLHKDEAVIPLDDPKADRMLADAMTRALGGTEGIGNLDGGTYGLGMQFSDEGLDTIIDKLRTIRDLARVDVPFLDANGNLDSGITRDLVRAGRYRL